MNESRERTQPLSRPARTVGLVLLATLCVVAVVAALVYASDIFLVLFLAILFGVFLTRTSALLAGLVSLPYLGCLAVVTSTLMLLMFVGIALFGVQVDAQISRLSRHLDEAQQRLQSLAERYPTMKSVLASTPFLRDLVEPSKASDEQQASKQGSSTDRDARASNGNSPASQNAPASEGNPFADLVSLRSTAKKGAAALASLFTTTFGLLVNSLLIFFVGLFVAVAPGRYRDGVVVLFPPARRERTREVMNHLGDTLWHWLLGRFGSMLVTGLGASLLLGLLGVPMAVTLGVATALLTFIPNLGALIALLLAVLLALPQGAWTVLIVVVGYTAFQLIESYLMTPLIQKKQVSLPPALLLSFQAVMSVLFGFLGAAVASPLLAVAKVGVEEAYVHDVLEAETGRGEAVG